MDAPGKPDDGLFAAVAWLCGACPGRKEIRFKIDRRSTLYWKAAPARQVFTAGVLDTLLEHEIRLSL